MSPWLSFERLIENGSILVRSLIAPSSHYALFRLCKFLNCRIHSTCKFFRAEDCAGSNPVGDASFAVNPWLVPSRGTAAGTFFHGVITPYAIGPKGNVFIKPESNWRRSVQSCRLLLSYHMFWIEASSVANRSSKPECRASILVLH